MTHDELLDNVQKMYDVDGIYELYNALRAVVELHSHTMDNHDRCTVDGQLHPCITIKAIEKELP